MILYLDTSCLAKMYLPEIGAEIVRTAVERADLVTTSMLAYTEMRSALGRRRRERLFSEIQYRHILRQFARDWKKISRIPITERLIETAGDLADDHGLRSIDAIHLASAITLRKAMPGTTTAFFSADARLNTAAAHEGFEDTFPAMA